jgi:hypothetical protein
MFGGIGTWSAESSIDSFFFFFFFRLFVAGAGGDLAEVDVFAVFDVFDVLIVAEGFEESSRFLWGRFNVFFGGKEIAFFTHHTDNFCKK